MSRSISASNSLKRFRFSYQCTQSERISCRFPRQIVMRFHPITGWILMESIDSVKHGLAQIQRFQCGHLGTHILCHCTQFIGWIGSQQKTLEPRKCLSHFAQCCNGIVKGWSIGIRLLHIQQLLGEPLQKREQNGQSGCSGEGRGGGVGRQMDS